MLCLFSWPRNRQKWAIYGAINRQKGLENLYGSDLLKSAYISLHVPPLGSDKCSLAPPNPILTFSPFLAKVCKIRNPWYQFQSWLNHNNCSCCEESRLTPASFSVGRSSHAPLRQYVTTTCLINLFRQYVPPECSTKCSTTMFYQHISSKLLYCLSFSEIIRLLHP